MPAEVDSCVTSLLAKWEKDPSSRPKPREEGQEAESQARAICQAAYNKRVAASLEMMFEGGLGPALMGAAATNRPYIPRLKPTRVVEEEDGEKKLLVHLANSGRFNHPFAGPFILNRQVFAAMIANFQSNVLGQDLTYDCGHRPDDGAFGWFRKLMLGDEIGEGGKEFWGVVEPTDLGLEQIEGKRFRYSSMEFHMNYDRSDVTLDLEGVTTDFCFVELEEPKEDSEVKMADEKTVALEQYQETLDKLAVLEQEQAREAEARKDAEKRVEEAQALVLEMQREALETSIQAVVELAQAAVDKDGNGLPRTLVEWIAKVLKFESLGEDEGVVKLSRDAEVGMEVRKYLIGAMKHLALNMPGVVPAKRKSAGGSDPDADKFDYASVWEE
jgi:hypothetical protein